MTLPPLCVNIHSRSINFSMKKWSKLVLATMLSVGTLLVSGCIESIEPEGIADLRGAKVELLNAQAALQMAQAAKAEADAALVLAEAKIKEETQATIRCVPFAYEQTPGIDMVSGKPAKSAPTTKYLSLIFFIFNSS